MKKYSKFLAVLAVYFFSSHSFAQVAKTFRSRNIDCTSKQDIGLPAYRAVKHSITTNSADMQMNLSFEALVCRQDASSSEFKFVSRKFNDPVLSQSLDGLPTHLYSRSQEFVVLDGSEENILQSFAVENNFLQELNFKLSYPQLMSPSDLANLARGEKVLVRFEVFLRGIYDFESNGEVIPLGLIGSNYYIALISLFQDPNTQQIHVIDFQLQ